MQKPIKPTRKFEKPAQKPLPPSKITTIVAYKPPNDLHNILDDDVIQPEDYYPKFIYDQKYSLKDLIRNIPKELLQNPEAIRVSIEFSHFYEDGQEYIQVEYDIPNENYDEEMTAYEQACKDYEKVYKAWKEENPMHKERLKKYREENKKYKIWRTAKIKELEKKGEL
jgi:hypothetical protein